MNSVEKLPAHVADSIIEPYGKARSGTGRANLETMRRAAP